MKKIAIQLYGHMRTYERTYKNFFENVVKVNEKDGYEVDIFIHTWDIFNLTDEKAWHKNRNYFPTLSNKKLSQANKDKIIKIYKPKNINFDSRQLAAGRYESVRSVVRLRQEYEKEKGVKYDYFITTRPDILFLKPLRLDFFLNFYDKKPFGEQRVLGEKFNFCPAYFFREPVFYNLPVVDYRFPNESDLFWIGNYSGGEMDALAAFKYPGILNIFINYKHYRDFIILRETTKDIKTELYDYINLSELEKLKDQNSIMTKANNAKMRIRNHLAYKLGSAMIRNSKSFLGYLKMPFILSSLALAHKEEQRNLEKISLPPLEFYSDYKEALKEKECPAYKLGLALMKAQKNWYGGGGFDIFTQRPA